MPTTLQTTEKSPGRARVEDRRIPCWDAGEVDRATALGALTHWFSVEEYGLVELYRAPTSDGDEQILALRGQQNVSTRAFPEKTLRVAHILRIDSSPVTSPVSG